MEMLLSFFFFCRGPEKELEHAVRRVGTVIGAIRSGAMYILYISAELSFEAKSPPLLHRRILDRLPRSDSIRNFAVSESVSRAGGLGGKDYRRGITVHGSRRAQ